MRSEQKNRMMGRQPFSQFARRLWFAPRFSALAWLLLIASADC